MSKNSMMGAAAALQLLIYTQKNMMPLQQAQISVCACPLTLWGPLSSLETFFSIISYSYLPLLPAAAA